MYRLIVVSDTHRTYDVLQRIVYREEQYADGFLHLGDLASDMQKVSSPVGCDCYAVKGNCDDRRSNDEESLVLTFENVCVFAAHGHRFRVKEWLGSFHYRMREVSARLGLYGHTHVRYERFEGDECMINPGYGARGEYLAVIFDAGNYLLSFETV